MTNPLDDLAREEHRRRLHELVELMTLAWEKEFGRSPTPDVLERITLQAEHDITFWTFRTAEIAKAESKVGRALTLDEQIEVEGLVKKKWAEECIGDTNGA